MRPHADDAAADGLVAVFEDQVHTRVGQEPRFVRGLVPECPAALPKGGDHICQVIGRSKSAGFDASPAGLIRHQAARACVAGRSRFYKPSRAIHG